MPVRIATVNCFKQSGCDKAKQNQISDFMTRNRVDVLHLQEMNYDEEMFKDFFIESNCNIFSNNATTARKVTIKNNLK